MDSVTTKNIAIQWGISDRRVLQYCKTGGLRAAVKMENTWLIPKDAKKPEDERYKK